jgi:hypothetical protein
MKKFTCRIESNLDALQAGVDAQKRLQVETTAELDALLSANLDHAFKGELLHSVTPELYRQKCSALFEHVYQSYPERDMGACAGII